MPVNLYMTIGSYFTAVVWTISTCIMLLHLLILAKLYVTDAYNKKTFLTELIGFETNTTEQFAWSIVAFFVVLLFELSLIYIWPIFILIIVGYIIYVVLRCIRYFLRKITQYKHKNCPECNGTGYVKVPYGGHSCTTCGSSKKII